MNRQELIDRVASAAELPRPAAARAVDAALEAIEASLRAGEPVRLTGFGKFHVAHYTGRAGVNPRTGERIEPEDDLGLAPGYRIAQPLRKRRAHRTACFSRTPAVKRGTAVVATSIRSPVRGLTPARPV